MKKQKTAVRITVGVSVPAALFLCVFLFLKFKSPPCFFYGATGLYCIGCGAGRALDSLFHLKILDALQYNLLFTLSLPYAALLLIKWYFSIILGKEIMKPIKISDKGAIIYAVILGAFFILRNIPYPPFNNLSPDVFL